MRQPQVLARPLRLPGRVHALRRRTVHRQMLADVRRRPRTLRRCVLSREQHSAAGHVRKLQPALPQHPPARQLHRPHPVLVLVERHRAHPGRARRHRHHLRLVQARPVHQVRQRQAHRGQGRAPPPLRQPRVVPPLGPRHGLQQRAEPRHLHPELTHMLRRGARIR